MSTRPQKAHSSRPAPPSNQESYFSDSPDEPEPHRDEEYIKLKELCDKASSSLKDHKMEEEIKPE